MIPGNDNAMNGCAALYEELRIKKDSFDRLEYIAPAYLPVGNDSVVNIRDLLPFEGVRFVNMAYMCILGRVPEKYGRALWLSVLSADSGRESKTAILKEIGSSEEARLRGTVITGFDSIAMEELCGYTGREFIQKAYIAILMRKPREEEEEQYLSMMDSGEYAPEEILFMLRHTQEGEKHSTDIPGLDEAYSLRIKRKRLMGIPVAGMLFRHIFKEDKKGE